MNVLKEGIIYNVKSYTSCFINVYQKTISITNRFQFAAASM